jgi:hypothetical protein
MNKFLCGVTDAYFYSTNEVLLFSAKTMLDSAIEVNVGNTEISGGQGDALLFNYYHTSRLNLTLTDAQWSIEELAANFGQSVVTSTSIWEEENIVLEAGGAGSVTYTPVVTPDGDTTIYGWVTQTDGTATKVTFSTKAFTLAGGATGETVCVRYYRANTAARYIEIPANIIPKIGRLVLDAQLFSSNSGDANGATLIGRVSVEVPRAQLSGSQSISMTASGVSNTPLKATALAYNTAGCNGSGIYAKITEIVTNANWYDNCQYLAVLDDSITLTVGTTSQLVVYGVPTTGSAFIVPAADLTFTSGTPAKATVSAGGLITYIAGSGTSLVTISITNKSAVTTAVNVTTV